MAGDLSGRGGLAYLMKLLQGGMWAPQQQGGGGTMWGGPGAGGWLGQQAGGGGAQAPVEAVGAAPVAPATVTGGAGPEDAQTALLRGLVETYSRTQPTIEEAYAAKAKARDPVQFARQQQEASLAAPFGPGGYFQGRMAEQKFTPEEILASQGNTAENQLKRMRKPLTEEQKKSLQGPGGPRVAAERTGGEFDPEELLRQNQIYRANRTYI